MGERNGGVGGIGNGVGRWRKRWKSLPFEQDPWYAQFFVGNIPPKTPWSDVWSFLMQKLEANSHHIVCVTQTVPADPQRPSNNVSVVLVYVGRPLVQKMRALNGIKMKHQSLQICPAADVHVLMVWNVLHRANAKKVAEIFGRPVDSVRPTRCMTPGSWLLTNLGGVDECFAALSLSGSKQPMRNGRSICLNVGLCVDVPQYDDRADPASNSLSPPPLRGGDGGDVGVGLGDGEHEECRDRGDGVSKGRDGACGNEPLADDVYEIAYHPAEDGRPNRRKRGSAEFGRDADGKDDSSGGRTGLKSKKARPRAAERASAEETVSLQQRPRPPPRNTRDPRDGPAKDRCGSPGRTSVLSRLRSDGAADSKVDSVAEVKKKPPPVVSLVDEDNVGGDGGAALKELQGGCFAHRRWRVELSSTSGIRLLPGPSGTFCIEGHSELRYKFFGEL